MKRQLNWKTLLILVGGLIASVVFVVLLHNFQVRRAASQLLTMADKEEKAGRLDKAANALELYVGFRPDDLNATARYGHLLATKATSPAQKFRAAQVLENVAAKDPNRYAELREAATLLTSVGQHRLARPHWELLLDRDKNDGVIEGKLALADIDQSKFDAADARFTRAIKNSPKEIDLYGLQAYLLRTKMNLPQRAAAVMDAMVAANRDQARAYVERARFRLDANLPGAEADLEAARKLKPDDVDLALVTARIALRDGATSKAVEGLTTAIAKGPASPELYLARGQALQMDGKVTEAIENYRKGAETFPNSSELRFVLIDTLIQQGKTAEAEPLLVAFQAKSPGSPGAIYLEAFMTYGQKKWAESIRKFEKTLPDLVAVPGLQRSALFNIGQAYERIASPEPALSAYRRALALTPEWTTGHLRVASVLASIGRVDEAIREYRTLPINTPGVRPALVSLRIFQNSRLPADQRRWDDIETLIADVESSGTKKIDSLGLRLDLLLARGRIAEARTLVEAARKDYPDQISPSLYLAFLLEAEKKPAEAMKVLDETKARFGDLATVRRALIRYWALQGGADASKNLTALASDLTKFSPADQSELLDALAIANLRIGNREQSSQLLDASIRQAPENVRLLIRKVDYALEKGADPAMADAIAQLRKVEGPDGIHWRLGEANRLLIVASTKKTKDGLAETRTHLDFVLKREPDSANAHRLLGYLNDIEGNKDQAIVEYQKGLLSGPTQGAALVRLASLLIDRGRYADANKLIVQAESRGVTLFESKQTVAEVAIRANDLLRGERLVEKAIATDSKVVKDQLWLAQMYSALKKPKEAEAAARRAVALAPTEPAPRLLLVLVLLQAENRAEALIEAAKAESQIGKEKHVELSRIALAIGNSVLASKHLDEALASRPDDLSILQEAARVALSANEPAKAITLFRKLIDPSLAASPEVVAESRRGLAQSLRMTGRIKSFEEAAALIDKNLQTSPDSLPDLRLKAVILSSIPGYRKDALRAFEKARGTQPYSDDEAFRLAQLFDTDGQWSAARQQVLSLISATPPPLAPTIWYVGRLLQRKEFDEANIWLNKLDSAHPKSLDLLGLKASWLHAKGRNPEAVALVDARLKDLPDSAPALARILDSIDEKEAASRILRGFAQPGTSPIRSLLLAQSLARQGKVSEAVDLCEAAWAKCPPELCATTALMIAMSDAARNDSANRARLTKGIETAMEKNPKQIVLSNALAQILLLDARFKEAEAVYNRAIDAFPDDAGLANNVAWMLSFVPGRQSEALAQIERAIEIEGPAPQFLDTRGLVRLAQGQVPPAIADFERSIAGNPSDVATVHFHLALAHLAAENRTQAMLELGRAKTLGFKPETLHPIEVPLYTKLNEALTSGK
jgi:Tfp pilus assembly protein PilF